MLAQSFTKMISTLVLFHAAGGASFDGALRCKATLVSSPLLCDRGFEEIDEFPLPSDMATHVSGLDSCMERYADRVVGAGAKNIGARERALKILSLLGQLNREEENKAKKKKQEEEKGSNESGDDEYDPCQPARPMGTISVLHHNNNNNNNNNNNDDDDDDSNDRCMR